MEIKYGVTGKQRKAMVTAVASIIGADAIYKGVPTCNYEVDYFTIDRSGTLIFDDSADSEEVEHLIEALAERGFVAEQVEPEGEDEGCGVEISIPADRVNAENLEKLLDEYSCAVTPQVRQTGNRLSGLAGTAYASLLT